MATIAHKKLVCLQDYEELAYEILPEAILSFYKGGADQEQTLRDNRDAFKRWRLMPRMLRGVESRSMTTTALGDEVLAPFSIAPSAMQKMAHDEGEIATAKAAEKHGIVYIMSTAATSTIEEVHAAAPAGKNWLQLYIFKDRAVTVDYIRRAEKANFKALVLTVDAPLLGRRLASERHELSNFSENSDENDNEQNSGGVSNYVANMYDANLTWGDVDWLKSITSLPIIVKGILRPDDAELAIEHKVSAIIVSNHGGRQLDGVQAAIDALPAIVKQVNRRCEVFVDGGFTCGTDVIKALAIGANMVFIGRPIIWGLAVDGCQGVQNVIQLLKNEVDLAMALSGCSSIRELDSSHVIHQNFLPRL